MSLDRPDRNTTIGGGDVATLLGLSPYDSMWAMWARKVGLIVEEHSEQMELRFELGRIFEPAIGRAFTHTTGLTLAGEQMELRHPKHPFLVGHADALVFEAAFPDVGEVETIDDALGIFEAKTQGGRPWDELPPHVLSQVRWYLGLSGLPHAWVGALFDRWQFRVYEVEADDGDFAFMVDRALAFWQLVEEGTPPPIDGSDATARAIGRVWPAHRDGAIEPLDAMRDRITRRNELKALIRTAEDELAEHENAIRAAIGDAELAAVDGIPVLSLRAQSATRVKGLRDIEKARPDLAAELIEAGLTTTTTTRVLRAVSTKERTA